MDSSKRFLLTFSAIIASVASAAPVTEERRATLRGGTGDSGKCTIEVQVDGAADVEIRGDRGLLRTLSGQPAHWRRFECSGRIPSNPADFQFHGVDGRGRQELVRDPRGVGGAAVIRIEDPDGGSEGYTFDLEWRGGSDFGGDGRRGLGRGSGFGTDQGIAACQQAVRERADQQYGARDIQFTSSALDNNPGRNDWIVGAFEALRGNNREAYRFSCSMNFANGRVRSVDINPPQRDGYNSGRGYDRTRDRASGRAFAGNPAAVGCQRAVEQRIQRDGYRNVEFGSVNADDRPGRNDWIVGSARAQRSRNDRYDDFDFGCSVNLNNGNIRSVEVNRR